MPAIENEALEQFADKLLEEKGVKKMNLEEEVVFQMRDDLVSRLEDRINAVIITSLNPQQAETFEKMIDEEKPIAEIQQFIAQQIPNLEELITQELLFFRETYLKP